MYDEKQVVTAVLQGDLRAFSALAAHHERLVYAMIRRLVKDEDDIKDVAQEVFIKVFRNLHRFDFQSKLSTWIARIAYTTGVNHLKKTTRERGDQTDDLDQLYFTTEDPGNLLVRKDALAYLEKLIAQLPDKYRVVITLFHLKEFTYSEIGEITGMPEGTVKTNLFRARQLLKDKIGNHLKISYEKHKRQRHTEPARPGHAAGGSENQLAGQKGDQNLSPAFRPVG